MGSQRSLLMTIVVDYLSSGVVSVFLLVFVVIFQAIMRGHQEEQSMLPLLPACGSSGVRH